MKINLKSGLLLIIGVILGMIVTYIGLNGQNKYIVTKVAPTPSFSPLNISTTDFSITNTESKSQLTGLSDNEAKNISNAVDYFEKLKYLRGYVKAIEMITPPENKEEQGWLDHLLGNDLASVNNGKPSPRFYNNANYHLLIGYDIKEITMKNNIYYANVSELRVINVGNNTAVYKVDAQDLIFELIHIDGNFKISKYYHSKATGTANLKYDGFIAH